MNGEYAAMEEAQYPPIGGNYNSPPYFPNDYGGNNMGYGQPETPGLGNLTSIAPVDTEATWFKKYWRPAMAWQYLAVCLFDFIIAPTALTTYLFLTSQTYIAWAPLTLTAGGLYHISMAVILGVAAWTRGQEKLNGVD